MKKKTVKVIALALLLAAAAAWAIKKRQAAPKGYSYGGSAAASLAGANDQPTGID